MAKETAVVTRARKMEAQSTPSRVISILENGLSRGIFIRW